MRNAVVVDASVAVKWVYQEDQSRQALVVRDMFDLIAPELILAECANILWKKVTRGQLGDEEAVLAAEVLARTPMEMVSHKRLTGVAMRLSVMLGHPAYDCFYLAIAESRRISLVTADERLLRKIRQSSAVLPNCIALTDIG